MRTAIPAAPASPADGRSSPAATPASWRPRSASSGASTSWSTTPPSTIINTASIQAYQSSPELLDYATTKAGIIAFTKALAAGLAEKGIRVNAVAPGPIWTPLIPATMPADKVKSFGEDTPMGRAGQPAELAPAYVFFASQESSYVSGEVLGVTGGKPLA